MALLLDKSTPCIKCRYDLKGLTLQDNCPECGVAVRRTYPGVKLRDRSPQWLQSIVNGLSLVRMGIRVQLWVLVPSLVIWLPAAIIQQKRRPFIPWISPILLTTFAIGLAVVLYGCNKIATPDREGPQGGTADRWRMMLRVAARTTILLLILIALGLAWESIQTPSGLLFGFFGLRDLLALAAAISMLTLACTLVAFKHYTRHIASLLPNSNLAKKARDALTVQVYFFPLDFIEFLIRFNEFCKELEDHVKLKRKHSLRDRLRRRKKT